jgi:hypothetical protein
MSSAERHLRINLDYDPCIPVVFFPAWLYRDILRYFDWHHRIFPLPVPILIADLGDFYCKTAYLSLLL